MPFLNTFTYNITDMTTGMDLLGPTDPSLLVSAITLPAFQIDSLLHVTKAVSIFGSVRC